MKLMNDPSPGLAADTTSPSAEPDDCALLLKWREGSHEAAAQLYQRYAGRLFAVARTRFSAELAARLDAEDVVQSAFRRFFHHVGLGDSIPDGVELWKLLLTIALNKIRDEESYHRAARRDVRRESGYAPEVAATHRSDGTVRLAIEEVMTPLPSEQQQAIRLRLAGYEVAEIAEQLGCSKRTIERALHDFRDRLEKALSDR